MMKSLDTILISFILITLFFPRILHGAEIDSSVRAESASAREYGISLEQRRSIGTFPRL